MKKKPTRPENGPVRNPAAIKKSGHQKQQSSFFSRYRGYIEFIAILALSFIVYGNSIKNDYNIDDGYVVSLDEANTLTQKGILGIPEILTSRYNVGDAGEGVTYGYRPLGKVTLAIEYSLWENDPQNSHFINVLLFAVNVFLLLLFMQQIAGMLQFKNNAVVYMAAFLFLIHPIHTEVVCSIKNREEILSYLFMLAALLSYFRYRETSGKWNILGFAVFMALGLLAKQTAFNAIGLVLLIALFDQLVRPAEETMRIGKLLKGLMTRQTMLLLAAGLVIAYLILGYIPAQIPYDFEGGNLETDPLDYFPASHQLGNSAQTVFFYIRKLLVPFPLLYYYGYNMLPDRGWDSLYPYLGILTILGLMFLLWQVLKTRKYLFPAFWVFFFCLTILPFANTGILFQNVTGIVGERLVYQASAGFCMILALGLYYAGEFIYRKYMAGPDKKAYQVVLGLVMAVAVPYLVLTINRNTQWKNKLTLYEHDIRYLGQSARANFIMAGAIMNRLNDKTLVMDNNQALLQSRTYLYQAVTVYPKYDAAWLGLANLYRNYFTMNDSAIVFLGKIDKQHPKYFSRSQEMLGDIYYQDSANAQKAINYYYRGIYSNPGNRPLYNKMSKVMYKENMYDSLKNFGEIGIKNNWEEGFFNKAEWFLFQDDTVTAIQHYQKAVDMGYRDPMLLENLAYYYKTKGQFIELNRLPKE